MKCQCLADDEQSDPSNKTEQFCGTQDEGFSTGCPDSKGCGQCSDKDPKKCSSDGCPVLNVPAPKQHLLPKRTDKKKKKKLDVVWWKKWWVWVIVFILLIIAAVVSLY